MKWLHYVVVKENREWMAKNRKTGDGREMEKRGMEEG